nr:hypothetical protein CFP56_53720 [Quercus suber]
MDMSTMTSTDGMAMSPTSTMSDMSTATSAMSMSMSMSSDTMMGMQDMAMTFFTASTTPLYSTSWTPTSDGQYAATCIFLIAFAALFRALLAIRVNFHPLLAAADAHRAGTRAYRSDPIEKSSQHPWRARESVLLGFLDVVLAGVGYLLRFCWKRLVWTVHCQFPGSLSASYSLNRSNLDIFRHLKPSSLATTFPRFDRVSEELQAPARRGAGFILQQAIHGNAVRPVLVSTRGRRPEKKYPKSHDSDQWA